MKSELLCQYYFQKQEFCTCLYGVGCLLCYSFVSFSFVVVLFSFFCHLFVVELFPF